MGRKVFLMMTVMMCMIAAIAQSLDANNEAWKNNLLYAGARLGGSLHFYTPSSDYFGNSGISLDNSSAFDGGFFIAFQPVDSFALQTEVLFNRDHTGFSQNRYITDSGYSFLVNLTQDFTMNILTIPILVKFMYRPGIFSIAGLAGVYFNIPLGQVEDNLNVTLVDFNYSVPTSRNYNFEASPGFMIGGVFGIKWGPGVIFADIRYASDFNDTKIELDDGSYSLFSAKRLHFSLGYEVGFVRRK